MRMRTHDLAHLIANEVKKLGEYDHGKRCEQCKECLYGLQNFIDELIVSSIEIEEDK